MRVTLTGASGLIGTPARGRAEGRGDDVDRARRATAADGAVARGHGRHVAAARRARRRRRRWPAATRSCTSRASAVDQRWTDAASARISASRESRHRAISSTGLARRRAAARRARSRPRRRLLRPARRRGRRRVRAPARTSSQRVCVAWSARPTRAEELGVRVVQRAHGRRARRRGGALARCCRRSGSASGGPVAGGGQYMPWIHVDDLVAHLRRALRRRGVERAGQRSRARAVHERRLLAAPSAARCTARRRCRSRAALRPALRRHGRDRHRGPARRPAAALELGYRFRHPTSTRRCATRYGQTAACRSARSCRSGSPAAGAEPPTGESCFRRGRRRPDDDADELSSRPVPRPPSRRSPCAWTARGADGRGQPDESR
jgi:NAD dependent epimerase/dehydratase family enzyme